MQPLPPPLARRYKDITDSFAIAEQAFQEEETPLPLDDIARSAIDFLVLYTEYVAAHKDNDPNGEWQTFLVDFVHTFTYTDAAGAMHNALEDNDIDGIVLDCCALDDVEEGETPRTPAERLEALREALLEIKSGFDELGLF